MLGNSGSHLTDDHQQRGLVFLVVCQHLDFRRRNSLALIKFFNFKVLALGNSLASTAPLGNQEKQYKESIK